MHTSGYHPGTSSDPKAEELGARPTRALATNKVNYKQCGLRDPLAYKEVACGKI
jgi:hypothetical protein